MRRGDYRSTTVSSGDVARVAVDALRDPAARNKTFAIFNDPAVAPGAWRKELQALRRDVPTDAAIEASTAAARDGRGAPAPTPARVVAPTPSRDRLMIEDRPAGEEASPTVGWEQAVSGAGQSTATPLSIQRGSPCGEAAPQHNPFDSA